MSLIQNMREKLADKVIKHYAKKERREREREEKQGLYEAKQAVYKLCAMSACLGIMGVRMECAENELTFWDPYQNARAKFNFFKVEDVRKNMEDLTNLIYDTFVRRQGKIDIKKDMCEFDLYLKIINYFYTQYRTDETFREIMAGANGVFNISGKTEVVRYDVDYPEGWTMAEAYQQSGAMFSRTFDDELTRISKKDFTRMVDKLFERNKDIYKKYHGFDSSIL